MPSERIQQREKTWLVSSGEKAHEPFRFVIKGVHSFRGRMSHRDKGAERNQVLLCDRFRVRLGNVTPRPFVTGVCVFRNILRESFIQPGGDAVSVKAVQYQVNDLVSEKVVAEFVGRIALNKKASLRMNPTRPRLQVAEGLKLLPFFRALKNVNVRFRVAGWLLPFQLLCNDAIMKLRFH